MKSELSYLAHNLCEIDKYRVETCCVIGKRHFFPFKICLYYKSYKCKNKNNMKVSKVTKLYTVEYESSL